MSLSDELKELGELHEAGTLTEAEFEAAKEKLLQGDDSPEATQTPNADQSGSNTALKVVLAIVLLIALIPVGFLGVGCLGALIAKRQVENVDDVLRRAFGGTVKANITTLCQGVDKFIVLNNGRHPESLEQLFLPDFNGATLLKGRKVPTDPWGNEFLYDPPMPGTRGFRVYSYGKDGVPGGDYEDRDIDNWMIEDGEI